MATVYKGNKVGTSQKEGLFSKFSEEGSEMKKLQYKQFLSVEPLIQTDINDPGTPLFSQDSRWKRMYIDTSELAVQRRAQDIARISKLVASSKGLWWESRLTGLETIDKSLRKKQLVKYQKIQGQAAEKEEAGFWKTVGNKLLETGKNVLSSLLSDVRITASTIEQAGVAGTGTHIDTFRNKAYLSDGSGTGKKVLDTILSYTGIAEAGKLNAAGKILGGAQTLNDHKGDGGKPIHKSFDSGGPHFSSEASIYGQFEAKPVLGTQIYGTEQQARDASMRDYYAQISSQVSKRQEKIQKYEEEFERFVETQGDLISGEIPGVDLREEFVNRYGKLILDSIEVGSEYDGLQPKNYLGETIAGDSRDARSLQGIGRWEKYHSTASLDFRESILKSDMAQISRSYGEVAPINTVGRNQTSNAPLRARILDLQGDSIQPINAIREEDGPKSSANTTIVYHPRAAKASSSLGTFTGSSVEKLTYKTREITEALGKLYTVKESGELPFDSDSVLESIGLIPFCICSITPDKRIYMNFPAYLESYDDSYTGEWESVRYVGRAENFYGYKGFTRSINLSFKVIAFNPDQLRPLYEELNRLVGVTAPTYDPTNLFMRGTLTTLTIGDLLRDKIGIVPSIKLSWDKDDPWEIEKGGESMKIRVPHVLTVSMQFTPIEEGVVEEGFGNYFVNDFEKNSAQAATPSVDRRSTETLPEVSKTAEEKVKLKDSPGGSLLSNVVQKFKG